MAARERRDRDVKKEDKREERNWKDGERSRSPAVFSCGEPDRDDSHRRRERDMTLHQIDRDIKSWCQETKRVLLAICTHIQFPFYLYLCVFGGSRSLCCVCTWWGVWELRGQDSVCFVVCVCVCERRRVVSWRVCICEYHVVCVCVSRGDSLCFSLLSVREGVKIMFSCVYVWVCGKVKRTWEEDALPHACTLWFMTRCVASDRVCALLSSVLNRKQHIQGVCVRF